MKLLSTVMDLPTTGGYPQGRLPIVITEYGNGVAAREPLHPSEGSIYQWQVERREHRSSFPTPSGRRQRLRVVLNSPEAALQRESETGRGTDVLEKLVLLSMWRKLVRKEPSCSHRYCSGHATAGGFANETSWSGWQTGSSWSRSWLIEVKMAVFAPTERQGKNCNCREAWALGQHAQGRHGVSETTDI